MPDKKINCHSCGLEFYPHTITYHNELPYCHMCDFQYLVKLMADERHSTMPGYFINNEHRQNFIFLLRYYSKENKSLKNFKMAAYINGIPEIFERYPLDKPIFIDHPLSWPFNWKVIHYKEEKYEEYRLLKKSPPILNEEMEWIRKDFQLLLICGEYLLTSQDVSNDSIQNYKLNLSKRLTIAGNQLLNEIFQTHFSSKGSL